VVVFERIAVGLLGCAVAAAVAVAAARTHGAPGNAPSAFLLPSAGGDAHGRAFAAGASLRTDIDPLRPPGLPEGARVDPETGLVTGIDLRPAAGETAVAWTLLASADGVQSAEALPEEIRALAGRRVVMAGFVMPLYEIDDFREFLLVGSHYACCFGRPPGLGGMALVRIADGQPAVKPVLAPMRISGRLVIRERRSRDGDLLLLFHLDEARAAPLGF
jgi:hypothetical protein